MDKENWLTKTYLDRIKQVCLVSPIINTIIIEPHEGSIRCHFLPIITSHKILAALFLCPILRWDVHNYYK